MIIIVLSGMLNLAPPTDRKKTESGAVMDGFRLFMIVKRKQWVCLLQVCEQRWQDNSEENQ